VESRRTADSHAGYPRSIKRLGDAPVSSVFPAPPLKFRTAGFPQYGFKQEFDRDLRGEYPLIHGQERRSARHNNGPEGQEPEGFGAGHPATILSRGPWLAGRFCCPARSWLTMASSEPLVTIRRLIFFVRRTLGWRVGPQFKPRVCSCMPSPVPRWTGRVPVTVTTPTALVFVVSAETRPPQTPGTLVLAWAV